MTTLRVFRLHLSVQSKHYYHYWGYYYCYCCYYYYKQNYYYYYKYYYNYYYCHGSQHYRWLCPIGDSQGSLPQTSTRQDCHDYYYD